MIVKCQYSADDDRVIATLVAKLGFAFKAGCIVRQSWDTTNTRLTLQSREPVDTALRETFGHFFLMLAKNVDSKILRAHEAFEARGIFRNTPKNQGWFE